MVVTRRAPPPQSPNSRSSSSQAVPRMAKVKVNQLNQPERSSPLANGKPKSADSMDSTEASKLKPKSKWRRKSTPKPKKGIFGRFIGFLFKVSIAWLATYSFFICQNPDKSSDSSVCHAICATRHKLLEPHVYPLIRSALSHPTIEPYVRGIEPYATHTHHALQPVAAGAISKFSTYVVPEWNARVVPQYYTYVDPYVQNALTYLDPYLAVAGTEYERYLAPHLRTGVVTAWMLQEQAQPYVILAWHRSVDGYRYAKPYARPAWEGFKGSVLRVSAYLAVYRRRFVDPHVAQMWAKIKELSGDVVVPTITEPPITPKPVPVAETPGQPSTVAAIFAEEGTHSPVPTPTQIPPPVLSNDETLSPTTPQVMVVTPGAVNVLGDGPIDPVTIPVPIEPDVVPPQEEEPTVIAPPAGDTPTPAPKQETPLPPAITDDESNLESFSAEIGLDEVDEEFEEVQFTPPQESDEERQARLKAKAEETAWKRKEITDRHTDWEYQLEDLKREQMEIYRLTLLNIRKNAAKALKKDPTLQRAIDAFAADGDRFLKGAESYLKNLIKEKKEDKDKGTLWERVVQKVEDKFEKRLDDVDRKVGDWYNGVAANERKLVEKATGAVTELAQKAQVDLGLDYSWLDDVTVEDWVRYHDLMRSSDSFHEEVLMVRNGTHPQSMDNPVFRSLKELRVEVEDIITGFKSRLRRIQRDGERALNVVDHDDDHSESKSTEDSPVSILPVADGEPIPQVTVGKSPEQVSEALKEAPLEDWATSKQKKPDEVHTSDEL